MTTNYLIPFEPTHPGTLIKEELGARKDLTQRELAIMLGVKPSFLNEIIKGKRPVTADIAVLLEKAMDIPATYWMKFQSQYEIYNAKLKKRYIKKIELITLWGNISQFVPIKYFKKKGFLSLDMADNIATIEAIYAVKSLEDLVNKYVARRSGFYRENNKYVIEDVINIYAWTSLAEYEAGRKKANIFNYEYLPQLIQELTEIFYTNNNTLVRIDDILTQFGIIFLIIDQVDKSPIEGYSFWSNNNPVIALTPVHNRIDHLALTLLHEIGHIELHLKNNKEIKLLDLSKNETSEIEKDANTYAQRHLIPPSSWADLIENFSPLSDNRLLEFSDKYRINPAIVAERAWLEMNGYSINPSIDQTLH